MHFTFYSFFSHLFKMNFKSAILTLLKEENHLCSIHMKGWRLLN